MTAEHVDCLSIRICWCNYDITVGATYDFFAPFHRYILSRNVSVEEPWLLRRVFECRINNAMLDGVRSSAATRLLDRCSHYDSGVEDGVWLVASVSAICSGALSLAVPISSTWAYPFSSKMLGYWACLHVAQYPWLICSMLEPICLMSVLQTQHLTCTVFTTFQWAISTFIAPWRLSRWLAILAVCLLVAEPSWCYATFFLFFGMYFGFFFMMILHFLTGFIAIVFGDYV